MDRSSNRHAKGIEVVLQSFEEDIIECTIQLRFPTANNEAKYEAVLTRLSTKTTKPKESEWSTLALLRDRQIKILQ